MLHLPLLFHAEYQVPETDTSYSWTKKLFCKAKIWWPRSNSIAVQTLRVEGERKKKNINISCQYKFLNQIGWVVMPACIEATCWYSALLITNQKSRCPWYIQKTKQTCQLMVYSSQSNEKILTQKLLFFLKLYYFKIGTAVSLKSY